ncbi:MAG TPA: SurA N-terminal domain-containing protein [Rhizomicrobium sp.]|nr:SurA N-terminal domain-containing protein [Rhizomicrobium sp.]
MLQQMRGFAKSWVSSILLGGLALAFAFWGIGDIFQGRTSTDVAFVGGRPITLESFQTEYRNEMRRRSMMGAEFTPEMARAMNLGKQVLDRALFRAALDNVADKLKLTISDALVAAQIKNMPDFKGPLGTFDKQTFLRVAADNGFTEQSFINQIRADTARDQMIRAVQDRYGIPAGYVSAIYAYQTEVRGAEYFEVPATAAGAIPAPTDAQLMTYVRAHSATFSTPEYREVTYAVVTPDDVMSKLPPVTDAQIKQQYDAQKDNYNIPEKRDIEQITFPTEADAKAARAKIDAGTSFVDIGKERGLKPNELSLGTQTQAVLDAARGKAAFSIAESAVTQPVKGPFGWVLMRVTKITPAIHKSLDDVKAEISDTVKKQLAGGKLVDIANAYQEAVDGGDTLADAAKKAGMRVVHLASVDSSGLTADGAKADLPNDPDFLPQIFQAEVGEEGEPFQTKATNYYAIKVDGVTPPKLKPLDQVRAQATEEWIAQQRARQLEAKAKELAAQATKNGIAAAAKSIGAPVEKSPGLQRNMPVDALSPATIKAIFSSPAGVGVYGPAAKGDGYVVAVTNSVLHLPAPFANPQFQQSVAQAGQQVGADLYLSLAAAAEKKQGVTIHQDRVNQVTGEGS